MDEIRRIWKWGLFILMIVAFAFGMISTTFSTKAASGNEYYVAPTGDDSSPGTIDQPWQTLAPVHARNFLPGDVIHFKRGEVWSGGLVIDDSGVEGNPITFTAYGTGNRPVFTSPGGQGSKNPIEVRADWVVVEGFLVQDTHEAGVYISNGSDHNIVRDIEATNVGIGIAIHGRHNLTTQNYIHDLHMVVNTPGGNDDYGAVGIWMFNHDNEISYNTMINCIAESYDYGYDGGAVEWFGDADRNYVHHNFAMGCNGFFEVGGGSCKDAIVAYNISLNNKLLGGFHLSGPFAGDIENFRFENNTVVEIGYDEMEYTVLWGGDIPPSTFIMRNNILYIGNFWFFSEYSNFLHDHNIFYLENPSTELSKFDAYIFGSREMIADPLFVDIPEDDFHIMKGSPAINAGVDLGYSLDFDDNQVPNGPAPDMGAFEYNTIEPTPTTVPSLTPIPPSTTLTPTPTTLPPSPTLEPSSTPKPTNTPTQTSTPKSTLTSTPSITPTSTHTHTPSETPSSTPLPADINGDGQVDVLDTQLCVNVVLGTEIDPVIVSRADVNTDGVVNVLDVQEIVNVMLVN